MTALTLPAVELAPVPVVEVAGESRCQMEWAYLPGLTWDRCERPATVDALIHCVACGTYVRSWCGPCAVDATAAGPPDVFLCVKCERPGVVIVAVHPRR
jgi:hypothetical protein